jgi:hypothetical protein
MLSVTASDMFTSTDLWVWATWKPAPSQQDITVTNIDFDVMRNFMMGAGFADTDFALDVKCSVNANLWLSEGFDVFMSTVEFDFTTRQEKKEDSNGRRARQSPEEDAAQYGRSSAIPSKGAYKQSQSQRRGDTEEAQFDRTSSSAGDFFQNVVMRVVEVGTGSSIENFHLVKQLRLKDDLPSSMTRLSVTAPQFEYFLGDPATQETWHLVSTGFTFELVNEEDAVLDTVISLDCRDADDSPHSCALYDPYNSLKQTSKSGSFTMHAGTHGNPEFLSYLLGGDQHISGIMSSSSVEGLCWSISGASGSLIFKACSITDYASESVEFLLSAKDIEVIVLSCLVDWSGLVLSYLVFIFSSDLIFFPPRRRLIFRLSPLILWMSYSSTVEIPQILFICTSMEL